MKLQIISDLHLDMWQYPEEDLDAVFHNDQGADALMIAGDLAEFKNFGQFTPLFRRWFKQYDRVFYTPGNHEYYGGAFWQIRNDRLPSWADRFENLTLLEMGSFEQYDGYIFAGSTIWTSCYESDWFAMDYLRNWMNDFSVIHNEKTGKAFHPADMVEIHIAEVRKLFELISATNNRVVVMTHHAPSSKSIHDKYKNNQRANAGYYSDLSEDILDNPQIKAWIHGHVHTPFDYQIGDCRVVCNPLGYQNEQQDFKHKLIEV